MALWRIRATVEDRPGFLSVLTASLALRAVNILAVQVHTTEAGAVDDFLVDAPDALTEADLIAAVHKGRGRDAWVARAQAHGLVDPPTQALALAGRVARDPDTLGEVLAQLLGGEFQGATGGAEVVLAPREEASRYGFAGAVMRLPDPHGGTYEVTRAAPDFTPAEYARAQALVDLAGAAAARPAAGAVLLLPDGAELLLRQAGPDDLAAVAAMHRRCSPRSRRRRYLSVTDAPPARLRRLLDPARCTTLVAELAAPQRADRVDGADGADGDDRIVAMASLVGEGEQAQVALLVEDGWQGRGVGTALLRRTRWLAAGVGFSAIVGYAHAENGPAVRTARRIGEPRIETDGGVVTVTLPLDNREAPAALAVADQATGTG